MEKDVLSSYQECGTKKKILNPHEESIFRPSNFMLQCEILYHPFYSIITNMTLLTLLILAVWRTHMNFMSLSHHWVSLAQRESIRAWNLKVWGLTPSWGLRLFTLSHTCDKMKNIFFYHNNCMSDSKENY